MMKTQRLHRSVPVRVTTRDAAQAWMRPLPPAERQPTTPQILRQLSDDYDLSRHPQNDLF